MYNVLIVDDERSVKKAFTSDFDKKSDTYEIVGTV